MDDTEHGVEEREHGIGRMIPGLGIISRYSKSMFVPDLLAGVTVWAMLVPQGLGYSTLAGMPAVAGLYAAIGALVLYWLWGSSRDLNVGPESTVAIMLATVLAPMAVSGSDEYIDRAGMLALLVGLVLVIGGLFRLGRIADFLSRPILAGYVFGSGILIVVSQVSGLLGLQIDPGLYATDLGGIVRNLDQIDVATALLGVLSIAIVVGFKKWIPLIPGALVAVVAAMILLAVFDPDIAVVGAFPRGLPVPNLPAVPLAEIGSLIGPAFAIALLVYPDSVLTSRSLAAINHYELDANREFYGIGAANVGAAFLGGFPVNGSQSRSFVLSDAGSRSQVANLWAAGFVVLTLVVLAPLFDYLPTTTLAGIVIVAGFGLLGTAEFRALWRYRRTEFWLAMVTIAAVIGIGMLIGILVAVGLSIMVVVVRAASPHTATLGRIPGTDTYRDIADHDDAIVFPGLLLYRFDAPLFFANAGVLRDGILDGVEAAPDPVSTVILDMESIADIDSTGAQVLMELIDELDDRDIGLVLARVRTEIRREIEESGIGSRLSMGGIYLEVDDAVEAALGAQS